MAGGCGHREGHRDRKGSSDLPVWPIPLEWAPSGLSQSPPPGARPAAGPGPGLRAGRGPWDPGGGAQRAGRAGRRVQECTPPAAAPPRASRADRAAPAELQGERHGRCETTPGRGAAGRGPEGLPGGVRGRAGAGGVSSRPRQPHRRAHGLQPGPRAAHGEGLGGTPSLSWGPGRAAGRAGPRGAGNRRVSAWTQAGRTELQLPRSLGDEHVGETLGRGIAHVGREEAGIREEGGRAGVCLRLLAQARPRWTADPGQQPGHHHAMCPLLSALPPSPV